MERSYALGPIRGMLLIALAIGLTGCSDSGDSQRQSNAKSRTSTDIRPVSQIFGPPPIPQAAAEPSGTTIQVAQPADGEYQPTALPPRRFPVVPDTSFVEAQEMVANSGDVEIQIPKNNQPVVERASPTTTFDADNDTAESEWSDPANPAAPDPTDVDPPGLDPSIFEPVDEADDAQPSQEQPRHEQPRHDHDVLEPNDDAAQTSTDDNYPKAQLPPRRLPPLAAAIDNDPITQPPAPPTRPVVSPLSAAPRLSPNDLGRSDHATPFEVDRTEPEVIAGSREEDVVEPSEQPADAVVLNPYVDDPLDASPEAPRRMPPVTTPSAAHSETVSNGGNISNAEESVETNAEDVATESSTGPSTKPSTESRAGRAGQVLSVPSLVRQNASPQEKIGNSDQQTTQAAPPRAARRGMVLSSRWSQSKRGATADEAVAAPMEPTVDPAGQQDTADVQNESPAPDSEFQPDDQLVPSADDGDQLQLAQPINSHASTTPTMSASLRPEPAESKVNDTVIASPRMLPPVDRPVDPPTLPPMVRSYRPPVAEMASAMPAVDRGAFEAVQRGYSLSWRGATYSARSEFIQALQMIAQALDARDGSTERTQALANGLQALEEVDDFTLDSRNIATVDLERVASAHRTPVLHGERLDRLTAIVAQQRYLTYAQERLAFACRGSAAGSEALYALGRLQSAKHEESKISSPKAMTLHQASLLAYEHNHRAANELGVLLARYGQWEDARQWLSKSASAKPTPESLTNLAFVCEKMGIHFEAQRARQAVAAMQPQAANPTSPQDPPPIVRVMDRSQFLQTSAPMSAPTR